MNIDPNLIAKSRDDAARRLPSTMTLGGDEVDQYIRCMDANDPYARYNQPGDTVLAMCEDIRARGGDEGLDAFHRLVLVRLIEQYPQRVAARSVTADIEALYEKVFRRVLRQMEDNPEGFYLYPKDFFVKDLGLCSLRLIPGGMRMVEEIAGIPRSILFDRGIAQVVEGAYFFLLRMRGFRPVYESHTDIRDIDEYNPEGYALFLNRIADMMRINPHIRGISSGAWFYDPRAVEISPRIGYLSEVPMKFGARRFYAGPNAGARANALARSGTRRKLYEEGKYEPTNYRLVWARRDLLRWADQLGTI